MNKALEIQNLYEFVSYSLNEDDFVKRMNTFCGIVALELTLRLQDESKFAFQCVDIIDSINQDVVSLVKMINRTRFIEEQPRVESNLFFEILKASYPLIYADYNYYNKIIKN